MSRVPVSKIVHVSPRVHCCTFGGHADVPQGARRGRGRRWGGKVVSFFRSAGSVLHDLLIFRSFVLKPYFHLRGRKSVFNDRLLHTVPFIVPYLLMRGRGQTRTEVFTWNHIGTRDHTNDLNEQVTSDNREYCYSVLLRHTATTARGIIKITTKYY